MCVNYNALCSILTGCSNLLATYWPSFSGENRQALDLCLRPQLHQLQAILKGQDLERSIELPGMSLDPWMLEEETRKWCCGWCMLKCYEVMTFVVQETNGAYQHIHIIPYPIIPVDFRFFRSFHIGILRCPGSWPLQLQWPCTRPATGRPLAMGWGLWIIKVSHGDGSCHVTDHWFMGISIPAKSELFCWSKDRVPEFWPGTKGSRAHHEDEISVEAGQVQAHH